MFVAESESGIACRIFAQVLKLTEGGEKKMMYNYWNGSPANFLFPGFLAGWLSVLLIPLALWSVFWMGWALWKAAKADSKVWFIVLLLVHTMGILDIIYILLISKKSGRKGRK